MGNYTQKPMQKNRQFGKNCWGERSKYWTNSATVSDIIRIMLKRRRFIPRYYFGATATITWRLWRDSTKTAQTTDWLTGWFWERDHTECVIVVIGLHLHGHCDGINCPASAYTCVVVGGGGGRMSHDLNNNVDVSSSLSGLLLFPLVLPLWNTSRGCGIQLTPLP